MRGAIESSDSRQGIADIIEIDIAAEEDGNDCPTDCMAGERRRQRQGAPLRRSLASDWRSFAKVIASLPESRRRCHPRPRALPPTRGAKRSCLVRRKPHFAHRAEPMRWRRSGFRAHRVAAAAETIPVARFDQGVGTQRESGSPRRAPRSAEPRPVIRKYSAGADWLSGCRP